MEVGRPRRLPLARGRREIRRPPVEPKNLARAVRYRQLALAEPDKAKAAILREIADEAERDVLCTVDKMDSINLRRSQPSKNLI